MKTRYSKPILKAQYSRAGLPTVLAVGAVSAAVGAASVAVGKMVGNNSYCRSKNNPLCLIIG